MTVPNTFGNRTASIPLADLDANFANHDAQFTALYNETDAAQGGALVGYNPALNYAADTLPGAIKGSDILRAGRTSPNAAFSFFSNYWTVIGCEGPGRAYLLQDIRDVWNTKYSALMTGGTTYVDGTYGSDANAGTIAAPWLTLDKAIRTSNSGLTIVMPCATAYDDTGFRYTDTQGDRPKMLIAPYGGATIATAGDSLSAATWASVGGGTPNVYVTTLVTANWVTRVLHSGLLDKYGRATPLPKQSSIATVDSVGIGWWYNSATQQLYVRYGAQNIQTTIKTSLSAVYATGGDNSLLILSAKLYLEGFTLRKYGYVLKQAGQAVPELWMKNCTIEYAESNSLSVFGGGCFTQDCIAHRSTADHANYNISGGTTAYGAEINYTTRFAGDVDTFGSGATQPNNPISTSQNKNGSSNHDSYVVRINGSHTDSYGPPIADTSTSKTWCLGTMAGYSYATAGSSQRYGFIMQGNDAWLDGCEGGPGLDASFNADSSASVRTFNCLGTTAATSGGVFTPVIPT